MTRRTWTPEPLFIATSNWIHPDDGAFPGLKVEIEPQFGCEGYVREASTYSETNDMDTEQEIRDAYDIIRERVFNSYDWVVNN